MSDIDPTVFPDNQKVAKRNLRGQFTIVKDEITALQQYTAVPSQMAFGGLDDDFTIPSLPFDLSAYLAKSTGGVTTRTFASRFEETVFASDHGAVGDGSDNTVALQRAIDRAVLLAIANGVGATVDIGMGTFVTSSTLTINHDCIHIRGCGVGSTFIVNNTDTDVISFTKGGALIQNVGLHDLRIYGTAVAPSAGARLRLVNVGLGTFENLYLEEGFQGLVIEGGLGNTFNNVNAFTANYWAAPIAGSSTLYLKASGTNWPAGPEFTNCFFESNGGNSNLADAVVIESADSAFFVNCHMGFAGNAAVRFRQIAGAQPLTGVVFTACYFDGFFGTNGANGVVIENPNGSTGSFGLFGFNSCYCFGDFTDAGFRVKSDATTLVSVNITGGFYGYAAASANIRLSAGSLFTINGAQIINGPAAGTGLLIDNAVSHVTIVGNIFANTSGSFTMANGITIAGTADHVTMTGNDFGALATPFTKTTSGTDISYAEDNVPALAWTTYSPTVVSETGAITSFVSVDGKYRRVGKTVQVNITIAINNNGTGATALHVPLPFTAVRDANLVGANSDYVSCPAVITTFASLTYARVVRYDSAYPGGAAKIIWITGVYECA